MSVLKVRLKSEHGRWYAVSSGVEVSVLSGVPHSILHPRTVVGMGENPEDALADCADLLKALREHGASSFAPKGETLYEITASVFLLGESTDDVSDRFWNALEQLLAPESGSSTVTELDQETGEPISTTLPPRRQSPASSPAIIVNDGDPAVTGPPATECVAKSLDRQRAELTQQSEALTQAKAEAEGYREFAEDDKAIAAALHGGESWDAGFEAGWDAARKRYEGVRSPHTT